MNRTIFPLTFLTITFIFSQCKDKDGPFGKGYNNIRSIYGSPIIHDYLELKIDEKSFQNWHIPKSIEDTISVGYHAGKGFYIHADSFLQEDDIFRKRISDTTLAYIGILTFGNIHKHKYTSIYYDTTYSNSVHVKCTGPCNNSSNKPLYEITLWQADSILSSWGTSRSKNIPSTLGCNKLLYSQYFFILILYPIS